MAYQKLLKLQCRLSRRCQLQPCSKLHQPGAKLHPLSPSTRQLALRLQVFFESLQGESAACPDCAAPAVATAAGPARLHNATAWSKAGRMVKLRRRKTARAAGSQIAGLQGSTAHFTEAVLPNMFCFLNASAVASMALHVDDARPTMRKCPHAERPSSGNMAHSACPCYGRVSKSKIKSKSEARRLPAKYASHLRGRGCLRGRANGSMWYRSASSIHRSTRSRCAACQLQVAGAVSRQSGALDTVKSGSQVQQLAVHP